MVLRVYSRVTYALQVEKRLILYRDIPQDSLVEKFLTLLKELVKSEINREQVIFLYYDFMADFLPVAAKLATQGKHAWNNYIVNLVLAEENLFSRQAEIKELAEIPAPLKEMAQKDLQYIQALAESGEDIRELITEELGIDCATEELPSWEGLDLNNKEEDEDKITLLESLHGLQKWEEGLKDLCNFYKLKGVGILGQHHAFCWSRKNGKGELVGVRNPDTINLNQLYEYEREQAKIINNTEQFLAGYPANNVLLYGDRGTGKSSTVKALINQYGDKGLRLVEIQKRHLEDFPLVIAQLAERPQKFILYIDDLSFSEEEGQYRELKALLEGGLESRPRNVLVYATSNRRHLVKESFADRKITGYDSENEDVRYMDTLQEKLSLADRFGITVTFMAPDQKRYLAIIEKMVEERGIEISREELIQHALKWELSFNARSARTARQFVDFLEGQLALGNHS